MTPRFNTWRPWFAWHPVTCEGHGVWLETIERLTRVESDYDGYRFEHQYRFIRPQHPSPAADGPLGIVNWLPRAEQHMA